ncbi:hypothetical protein C6P40_001320 [Pichia californica]|uniref:CCHC-type domain-containing protein n=1 Tax=Pichia californica TaxID=460514 RepID=A0A9P6WJW0_9ASCO|nr:hypothetical protein C6P42_000277 [[Candida] californica]KAG0688169.1 hypothetical protein C6P40_001320 [[Candida] californica]
MSNTDLEKQIKELNNKISELALMVSLKTKEMDEIEKNYSKRLNSINDYFSKVRKSLAIEECEGTIKDTEFIDKIQALNVNKEDCIIIPTKIIRIVPFEKNAITSIENSTEKDINVVPFSVSKDPSHSRRKKISCSYCNEKGHKRSQCPKILYNEV